MVVNLRHFALFHWTRCSPCRHLSSDRLRLGRYSRNKLDWGARACPRGGTLSSPFLVTGASMPSRTICPIGAALLNTKDGISGNNPAFMHQFRGAFRPRSFGVSKQIARIEGHRKHRLGFEGAVRGTFGRAGKEGTGEADAHTHCFSEFRALGLTHCGWELESIREECRLRDFSPSSLATWTTQ
jgi:hypothetical protein